MNKHIRSFFMGSSDVYVNWKSQVGKAWRNHIIINLILSIFYLGQYQDFKSFRDEWNVKQKGEKIE